MSERLKGLVLAWGLAWLGIGAISLLSFWAAALTYDPDWHVSLILVACLFAGLVCGGLLAITALLSWTRAVPRPFRLPPAWALGGGLVLALAVGLGLWQGRFSLTFLVPICVALTAMLAPLAVVAWIMEGRPGSVTARRGWAAYGLGGTASTSLALVLNLLLPAGALFLVYGLADTVLPLAEELLDALAFGPLSKDLLSPGFLVVLVQAAVIAPLVEELVKPLPLLPLLKRLASPRDALLVGMLAGAGFAAVENILYAALFGSGFLGVLAVRTLGTALHPFGAGMMAVAWRAVLRREPDASRQWARNYGLAAGVHAMWNGTCVVAATVASAWFQGWEIDLLGVTDAVVLLALLAVEGAGLLVALRALARRLEARETGSEIVLSERAVAVWGLICLVVLVPVGLGVLQALW